MEPFIDVDAKEATMVAVDIRSARPSDFDDVVAVVDQWWGRPVAAGLPRLFLDHFFATSLIAESETTLTGFLVGFHSPSRADVAYIHFVGVAPAHRRAGLARRLYTRFYSDARENGCRLVRAITSPANSASISYHLREGFSASDPIGDYDGPGVDRVVFERWI